MKRKTPFLVLMLLFPVAVVLFLKIFGSNTFEVPVFYQDGIPDNNCNQEYEIPYSVSSDFLTQNQTTVFGFISNIERFEVVEFIKEVQRRSGDNGQSKYVIFTEDDSFAKAEGSIEFRIVESLENIGRCHLFISQNKPWTSDFFNQLTMVDREGKIRGYYDMTDIEEQDRLLVEMEILEQYGD